jgi:hypothetical protein
MEMSGAVATLSQTELTEAVQLWLRSKGYETTSLVNFDARFYQTGFRSEIYRGLSLVVEASVHVESVSK